jgi:hypothetical protein
MKKAICMSLTMLLFTVLAFSQSTKIIYDESKAVYYKVGEKFYHKEGCPLLGGSRAAKSFLLAVQEGMEPCPECFKEEIQAALKQKSGSSISFPNVESGPKVNPINMNSGGFRGIQWGLTEADVRKAEAGEIASAQVNNIGLKVLAFKGKIGNLECLVGYYFAENKLVEGRYIFVNEHSNPTLFIDDYHEIDSSIQEKYGTPSEKDTIWRDELYKSKPAEWGMAVQVGHLAFQTMWNLKDCSIIHLLKGDNFAANHAVDYQCTKPELLSLIKKVGEEAKKKIW